LFSLLLSFALAAPVVAQQAQPPLERPANYPLRPHPPGLTPKDPKDIPLNKIKLPPGFEISLWASGIVNPRSLTTGDKGTIFVGTRDAGNVYAVVDQGGVRRVITIAKRLHRPNGVAFKDGALYVAEVNRIPRFDNIETRLENPPAPVVVRDDYPTLGMRFYAGSMFPPEYRHRIFIAQRGSWDRPQKLGYRVMQVTVTPGQPPKYEPFATGWLEGEQFWGRPVDVEVMRDGSLLVSDEVAGALYRITYKR